MKAVAELPFPRLFRGRFCVPENGAGASPSPFPNHLAQYPDDDIVAITDQGLFEATGVRVAFTERTGGESAGAYGSLNLGSHVHDDPACVAANRQRLLSALGAEGASLVVANQVHGTNVERIESGDAACVEALRHRVSEGADGIVVGCPDVAALLCFADCMPVVLVAPGGTFAVVHAGWRGVFGHIVVKALDLLCETSGAAAGSCNVYIGPYIHAECFEVGTDLARKFSAEFGSHCVPDSRHVDLGAAVRADLAAVGVDGRRIADSDACTVCSNRRFFSYRAQGGTCGRHAAVALRFESEE